MPAPGVGTPHPPNRSQASGSEVVAIVDAAFSAVRAERDEARGLLDDVLADAGPHLSPALVERITSAIGTP